LDQFALANFFAFGRHNFGTQILMAWKQNSSTWDILHFEHDLMFHYFKACLKIAREIKLSVNHLTNSICTWILGHQNL
jgi:hypothetical protein